MGGSIQFQQQIARQFTCRNDRVWRLGQIIDRVLNGQRLLQVSDGALAVSGGFRSKRLCFPRLQADDLLNKWMLPRLLR